MAQAEPMPSEPNRWNVLDPGLGGGGDPERPVDAVVRRILERCAPDDEIVFPAGRTYVVDHVILNKPVTVQATGAVLRKAPTTVDHMFVDRTAAADGTRVVGGRYELSREAFEPGQTVSAYHFVRARDLTFTGVEIVDGIEEGLKLYGCAGVRVLGSTFRRIRNNGVQFHTPAIDGFQGTRAKADSSDLIVQGCVFEDVDDDAEGRLDGHGVTFNATDPRFTTRDGVVHGCTFRRCIRGIWAEFGGGADREPGRGLRFVDNRVEASRFFGIGMVGVEDGWIVGNTVLDTGARVPEPGRTSDESVGIVVSGDRWAEARRITCAENEVHDTRPAGERLMEFGLRIKRGSGHVVRGNRVSGAVRAALEVAERDVTDSVIEPPRAEDASAQFPPGPAALR